MRIGLGDAFISTIHDRIFSRNAQTLWLPNRLEILFHAVLEALRQRTSLE